LLATLQLHAAGIVLAFGFSLLYVGEFALQTYRRRSLGSPLPLMSFAIGAAGGSALFYLLNVQPVGGLGPFLDFLVRTRGTPSGGYAFLTWPSLLEGGIILAAFAFILWRRNASDRFLLRVVACVIIGILLFDRPGYRTHFSPLYVVPVGAFMAGAFSPPTSTIKHQSRVSVFLTIAVMTMMVGQVAGEFVNWPAVGRWLGGDGLPPFLYQELKRPLTSLLHEDDVVASTHQLIWAFPEQPTLVSYAAEAMAMARWSLTDAAQVWERVQPSVIVYVEREMELTAGLQTYMARHHFTECQEIDVLETRVILYRAVCP
jgi:hypothetical protein